MLKFPVIDQLSAVSLCQGWAAPTERLCYLFHLSIIGVVAAFSFIFSVTDF